MRSALLLLLVGATLTGCGLFGKDKVRLEGKRIPILVHEKQLRPDASLTNVPVRLPRPVDNVDWPEPGGEPDHAMGHLSLPENLHEVWSTSAGEGASSDRPLLARPVVAAGHVYTMDSESMITSMDVKTGKVLWKANLLSEDDEEAIGGGIAYDDGRIFVTTGFAKVIALDAESGKEIWRQTIPGPARAAPTVADGRVFVVTIDNQLHVLAASDGASLWTHSGIMEIAGLLGGASPAVAGAVVIVAYSSGEIYALRAANGRVLWSDNLSSLRRSVSAGQISDIRGMPVIDGDRVYAISNGGRMVAIDLRSGRRIWDKAFGGVQTPWVAGDYIYVLTNESELVCLNRKDGRVRWVVALRPYENMTDKEDPIYWTGPVLAGDRLIVAGSHGEALAISPYTGELLGKLRFPNPVSLAPIVAGRTLYVLTDDAELLAFR